MFGTEPTTLAFLQIAVILGAIRLVGTVARKLGQPQVIGEMVAGVLLGPSLLGWLFPEVQAALFPASSVAILKVLSNIGLVIYMFLIGVEFNTQVIRQRLQSAAAVSLVGIAAPFVLGAALALMFASNQNLFGPGVSAVEAMLFMGAAMSITAFPVLARIIEERGLTGTSLGTLVLAAGAINDAAAWCIFAVVLAASTGTPAVAVVAITGVVVYTLLAFLAKKTLLVHLRERALLRDGLSGRMLSAVLTLVMFGAWITDIVGVHAVFGAFVLGMAMPRGVVTRDLQSYLQPVAANFLVPLFFVYSGLNTQLGLVASGGMWALAVAVILVACVGKGGACWLAARLSGETNAQALAVGALMNARGLMELILLNIALERGIITPVLFAVMVVMAIGTTLMTTPLFDAIVRRERATAVDVPGAMPAKV